MTDINVRNTDIKTDSEITHVWMRMSPVYKPEYVKHPYMHDKDQLEEDKIRRCDAGVRFRFLCCSKMPGSMSFNDFADLYLAYEEKRKGNYEKRRKRYGTFFDFQMPLKNWDTGAEKYFQANDQLKKVVRSVANQLVDGEFGLMWAAWTFFMPRAKQKNPWVYVRIWICDREVYREEDTLKALANGGIKSYYKSTRYINPKTGKFCRKSDPGAVLLYRKGQEKCVETDSASPFKAAKTNRFKFRKGMDAWYELRIWLLDCYRNALKQLGMCFRKSILFKRRVRKMWFNRYVKRCVTRENKAQRNMEEILSRLYAESLSDRGLDKDDHDLLCSINPSSSAGWNTTAELMRTADTKQVEALRDRFQEILDKHVFFDSDGVIHHLAGRCDLVEQEYTVLEEYFKQCAERLESSWKIRELKEVFGHLEIA